MAQQVVFDAIFSLTIVSEQHNEGENQCDRQQVISMTLRGCCQKKRRNWGTAALRKAVPGRGTTILRWCRQIVVPPPGTGAVAAKSSPVAGSLVGAKKIRCR